MTVLRYYQKAMLEYGLSVANPLWFVKMRLGKTLVAIRWVSSLVSNGMVLVTAPYSALYSWVDELEKEGELTVTLLDGNTHQRRAQIEQLGSCLADGIHWVLVNPEFHLWVPELAALSWEIVIHDECTYLTNHKSKTWDFYSRAFRHVPTRAGLTGTPNPEGDYQFWPLCTVIEPNVFLETSYYKFERANFGILPNHKRLTNARGGAYISSRLAKYAYFLTRDDVNMGGEKIYQVVYVKMPDKTRKVYRVAEEEFLLEYSNVESTTIYATTKYIWLRRLCSGLVDSIQIDTAKIDCLLGLLSGELVGQQVIIWAHYTDELKMIAIAIRNRLKRSVGLVYGDVSPPRRRKTMAAFVAGEIDYFVAQGSCHRFGANLSACDTMIYFSSAESALTRQQTEERTIDLSNRRSKLIIDLVTHDTVEGDIYKGHARKEGRQSVLRRLIQGIQRRTNATR